METEVVKNIEMKVINYIKTFKQRLIEQNKLRIEEDCPEEVRKAIDSITTKINQSKFSQLHPPFFPKTLTRFRHQYFLPLKKQYHNKLSDKNATQFKTSINILHSFIAHFDCQYVDTYLEQIRQPYINKMFNDNYEFDTINFKDINNEYKIRAETENLLNCASEWLIQIEKTQDLLERVELYFDIKTPFIIEKAKKEGVDAGSKRSWGQTLFSMMRNVSSYALRKSSKVIQSTFFTTVAPAAAMLSFAIIGGTNLPWKSSMNSNLLIAPLIAATVPYLLDGLASTIQRKEYMEMLEQWAVSMDEVSGNIRNFNEELQQTIVLCSSSETYEEYAKSKINLEKYVGKLKSSLKSLTDFKEEDFQEMRDRTEAYFKKYVEISQGQWTIVIPEEDYSNLGKKSFS